MPVSIFQCLKLAGKQGFDSLEQAWWNVLDPFLVDFPLRDALDSTVPAFERWEPVTLED